MPDKDWFQQNAPTGDDWFKQNSPAAVATPDHALSFMDKVRTAEKKKPDSVGYGVIRRLGDVGKGFLDLPTPKSPEERILSLLGPAAVPAKHMIEGYINDLSTTHQQAESEFREAKEINDPILRTLANVRAGTTAVGGAIPLVSSSVANINKLKEEGRNKEATGQGLTDAALLLLGGTKKGREATTYPAKRAVAEGKMMIQEAGGAGREPVIEAVEKRRALIDRQNKAYQAKLEEVERHNAEAIQEAARKTAESRAEALRSSLEKRAEIEGLNAQQRAEWVRKEMAARRAETQVAANRAQMEVIERGQRAYAQKAIENAKATFKKVKDGLDSRWNQMRDAIGTVPINSSNIAEAIETAKSKYLMGAPESLKQFNDLMRQMEGNELIDTKEGVVPLKSLTWEEGRTHYSALGDKMMSGELPGNVRKAVELVRDELDAELGYAAKNAGRDVEYTSLKHDWSQFKKDWDDMSNLSYSKSAMGEAGSPLARLVRAADPAAAARVLGNERILPQLARYSKEGANLGLAKGFRSLDKRLGEIEKVSVPKHPERPRYKSAGETETTAEIIPKLKPVPMRPTEPPPVDPVAIRAKRLLSYSGRPFRWYDYFTPTGIERLLVKNDTIRKLAAEHPREDVLE